MLAPDRASSGCPYFTSCNSPVVVFDSVSLVEVWTCTPLQDILFSCMSSKYLFNLALRSQMCLSTTVAGNRRPLVMPKLMAEC